MYCWLWTAMYAGRRCRLACHANSTSARRGDPLPGHCCRRSDRCPQPCPFHGRSPGSPNAATSANEHDDFGNGWRDRMDRVALSVSPDALRAIATELYTMSLLRGGYTHVCRFHYLHHDQDGGRSTKIRC